MFINSNYNSYIYSILPDFDRPTYLYMGIALITAVALYALKMQVLFCFSLILFLGAVSYKYNRLIKDMRDKSSALNKEVDMMEKSIKELADLEPELTLSVDSYVQVMQNLQAQNQKDIEVKTSLTERFEEFQKNLDNVAAIQKQIKQRIKQFTPFNEKQTARLKEVNDCLKERAAFIDSLQNKQMANMTEAGGTYLKESIYFSEITISFSNEIDGMKSFIDEYEIQNSILKAQMSHLKQLEKETRKLEQIEKELRTDEKSLSDTTVDLQGLEESIERGALNHILEFLEEEYK